MKELLIDFFHSPFVWFGIVWFMIYGSKCFEIHFLKEESEKLKKNNILFFYNQIWFNGLGSFMGWIAIYYLWNVNQKDLNIGHLVVLLIGYLGITGNLPFVSKFFKA